MKTLNELRKQKVENLSTEELGHYIRRLRNDVIPPRIVKNCEVISSQYNRTVLTLIKPDFETRKGDWNVLGMGNTFYQNESQFSDILGLPTSLNDILIMLDGGEFATYCATSKGKILQEQFKLKEIARIDLAEPNIQKQKRSVLISLINLLK